jgi:hypothetical protein
MRLRTIIAENGIAASGIAAIIAILWFASPAPLRPNIPDEEILHFMPENFTITTGLTTNNLVTCWSDTSSGGPSGTVVFTTTPLTSGTTITFSSSH